MKTITQKKRPSSERGLTETFWLSGRHSFSFGDYYSPEHMGFRGLRVINEDHVRAGQGFPTHPHRDMEIITVVVSGALEHKDSLGHAERLLPGEVQVMSAGSGIRHSEYNPLADEDLHLLQIWIEPEQKSLSPSYGQRSFPEELRMNKLCRVAGRDNLAEDTALKIHQDASVYVSTLEEGQDIELLALPGRGYWIQLISGELEIGNHSLSAGDGFAIENSGDEPESLSLLGKNEREASRFILFDLGAK